MPLVCSSAGYDNDSSATRSRAVFRLRSKVIPMNTRGTSKKEANVRSIRLTMGIPMPILPSSTLRTHVRFEASGSSDSGGLSPVSVIHPLSPIFHYLPNPDGSTEHTPLNLVRHKDRHPEVVNAVHRQCCGHGHRLPVGCGTPRPRPRSLRPRRRVISCLPCPSLCHRLLRCRHFLPCCLSER